MREILFWALTGPIKETGKQGRQIAQATAALQITFDPVAVLRGARLRQLKPRSAQQVLRGTNIGWLGKEG